MVSPCKGKTKKECEQIRLEGIRKNLDILQAVLPHISKDKVDKKYLAEARKFMSAIRWYISHKRSWPAEYQGRARPSIEWVWKTLQKNSPIVECAEILARSAPMDREQRDARDRLLYNLSNTLNYVEPPPKIEGSDIKGDPKNIHPANIRHMAEQKKRKLLDRRNELHALKPKKTQKELEELAKERRKLTIKQRKASKAKFVRLEKERGSEKERGITIGN